MGDRTGNPTWVDSATVQEAQANPARKITAAKLNAIEDAIDATPVVTISEDYVLTTDYLGENPPAGEVPHRVQAPPPSGGDDTDMLASLLSAGGQILLAPYVTYKITSTLTVNPATTQLHGTYTRIDATAITADDVMRVRSSSAGNYIAPTLKGLIFEFAEDVDAGIGLRFGGSGVLSSSILVEDCTFLHGWDQTYFEENAYLIRFSHCYFRWGRNAQVHFAGGPNSGENISFVACNLADCKEGSAAIICDGDGASLKFLACSLDYAARAIWCKDGLVSLIGCHLESSTAANEAGASEYIYVDGSTDYTNPTVTVTDCMWSPQWSPSFTFVRVNRRFATYLDRGSRVATKSGIVHNHVVQQQTSFNQWGRCDVKDVIYTYAPAYLPESQCAIANYHFNDGLVSWTLGGAVAPSVTSSQCHFSVTDQTSLISQTFPMRAGEALVIDFRYSVALSDGELQYNVDFLDSAGNVLGSAWNDDRTPGTAATLTRYIDMWLNKGSGAAAMSNYFAPPGTASARFRIGFLSAATGTAVVDDCRVFVA